MLTRPQSRLLRQILLLGLVVLGIMIVGVFWVEGYDRDQYVNALQISGQVAQGHGARRAQQVDSALNDSLVIFGFLAILLAPMALALAETGPGGAGWKLLTFLCCAFAAWFLIFPSNLLIAVVAWVLAWAVAMAMRMSFNRRLRKA
jgi:hypothetical protein